MTGGQMAPTTLPGQVSSTTPEGRGAFQGPPLKVAELIAGLDGPVYVERTALFDQKSRIRTKRAIRKILQLQMAGTGFGFVEVLAECPTHLKMTPLQAEAWVKDVMVPTYPLGVLKNVEREPAFLWAAPEYDPARVMEVLDAPREAMPRFAKGFPTHLHPHDIAIKLAGAGGDGVQTAAMLLAKTAIAEGFDATHIPSYGPESRGGTTYADVHVAREEVLSPASPRPHMLIAFNAPSLAKFGPAVREGGIVVYDSSVISELPALAARVKVVGVPATEIAVGLGKAVAKNMVLLGALVAVTDVLPEESVLATVARSLRADCAMLELNVEAFKAGGRAEG
jgi:2-oxoisovalerate ferredoxin oxidoreductase beta subunit